MSKSGKKKDGKANPPLKRTDAAEVFVEKLLSIPFIAEFVFRSPKKLDGGTDKEVADLLIAQENLSLLTSQEMPGRSRQPRQSQDRIVGSQAIQERCEPIARCTANRFKQADLV